MESDYLLHDLDHCICTHLKVREQFEFRLTIGGHIETFASPIPCTVENLFIGIET